MEFLSSSVEQTLEFASSLAQTFTGGEILAINGDLGAGKTVFCKGICKALGVTCVVTSPTFCLHAIYEGRLVVHHFDVYRLQDEEQAVFAGLEEYFGQEGSVSLIEWAQNIRGILRGKIIAVDITSLDEHTRKISVCHQVW